MALEFQVKDGPKDLDVLAWMGRTALELIGRGGLGHSFDRLVAESKDEFTESLKRFMFVSTIYLSLGSISPYALDSFSFLAPRPTT